MYPIIKYAKYWYRNIASLIMQKYIWPSFIQLPTLENSDKLLFSFLDSLYATLMFSVKKKNNLGKEEHKYSNSRL